MQFNSDFIESMGVFMVLKPDIACLWGTTSTQQVRQVNASTVFPDFSGAAKAVDEFSFQASPA